MNIDAMSGVEFEAYVAEILRLDGYAVEVTKATGDFGVDLLARRGGSSVAVQCKRLSKPVTGSAIQQVVAGAVMYGCTSTMVVTNQVFTVAAIELARQNNCRLVDREELQQMEDHGRDDSTQGLSRAGIAAAKGNWERAERLATKAADWGDSFTDLAGIRAVGREWAEAERFTVEAYVRGNFNAFLELALHYDEVERIEDVQRLVARVCPVDRPPEMSIEEWEQRISDRITLLLLLDQRTEAEDLVWNAPEEIVQSLLEALLLGLVSDQRWEEAERLAKRAPDPGSPLETLALLLAHEFRWEEAERSADEAAEYGHTYTQDLLDSVTDYEVLKRRLEEGR